MLTWCYFRNKDGVAQNNVDVELLKKQVAELGEKSNEQENEISDLKANAESANINIGLNKRAADEQFDDLREIIDRHEREIEELKNRPLASAPIEMPEMPEIKGDGLELN